MSEAWKRWEGQVVAGKFHLRNYLGGSDHSAVFLTGRDEQPASKAVIKLIAVTPENVALQLSQWELAGGLSHPHLVRLFEWGRCELESTELLYVVMDYAEDDLSKILPHRPLTTAETTEMLQPVLDAMAYVHGQGFVHGHIKPENIMVVNDQIRISSDGLCQVGESSCSLGTLSIFHPPEAARGEISTAADVWGIGMAMVVALTQHFSGWEAGSQSEPALPQSLPQPFLDIARHSLVRDPRRRWTVANIAARLQQGASTVSPQPAAITPENAPAPQKVQRPTPQPIPASGMQKTPAPRNGSTPARRHSILPVIVIGILLVAILAGIRLLTHRSQPRQTPATTAVIRKPQTSNGAAASSHLHPQKVTAPPAGQVVKGTVVHQVMPDVPRRAQATIHGTIRVRVRVHVDASGKVVGAALEAPGSSRYFAERALQAARGWQFTPAQVDGRSVPSQWTLRFEFRRKGTKVVPVQS